MEAKIVEIIKAGAVGDSVPMDTTIVISGEPPEFNSHIGNVGGDFFFDKGWKKQYKDFYGEQADLLFDALVKSLPGGTLGQLAVRLLDRYSSLLRVPL